MFVGFCLLRSFTLTAEYTRRRDTPQVALYYFMPAALGLRWQWCGEVFTWLVVWSQSQKPYVLIVVARFQVQMRRRRTSYRRVLAFRVTHTFIQTNMWTLLYSSRTISLNNTAHTVDCQALLLTVWWYLYLRSSPRHYFECVFKGKPEKKCNAFNVIRRRRVRNKARRFNVPFGLIRRSIWVFKMLTCHTVILYCMRWTSVQLLRYAADIFYICSIGAIVLNFLAFCDETKGAIIVGSF